jgi:phage shock protein C
MQMNRRLYRCRSNRVLAGVAGGVAEYFDLDPTLVRVLWFVSVFFGGISLVLYMGLAIIMPLEPLGEAAHAGAADSALATEPHRHASRGSGRLTTFVGIGLILFGALALLQALLPSWADSWRYLWPVFLIGIGGVLVAGALRRESTEL